MRCHLRPPSSSIVPEIVTRGGLAAVARSFGAVARQVHERLAQQRFVAGQIDESAFALDGALRMASCSSSATRSTSALHRHRLVADFERLGETQEFRHHVGERARLIQDAFGRIADVARLRFAADHLRVAGNRRQRVLEFVRDARGHLAQRREIFLPADLLLQRGQFRQIAHQAERAAHFHARSAPAGLSTHAGRAGVRERAR